MIGGNHNQVDGKRREEKMCCEDIMGFERNVEVRSGEKAAAYEKEKDNTAKPMLHAAAFSFFPSDKIEDMAEN